MNWVSYSLLMFCSSVALYLFVRKATLARVSTSVINLSMFAIPMFVYASLGLSLNTNFSLKLWQWLFLIVSAVVFAFGGNAASLYALKRAPNPGYSLVLAKSYVLFTTGVAIIFLHQGITLKKAIAILLILAFSTLILINPKSSKSSSGKGWIWLSVAAFFAWGMLSLISKYLFQHGVNTYAFLIYLYIIVTVCIVGVNKMSLKTFKVIKSYQWLLLLGIGIFSSLFNLGQFEAISIAPNVGYVNAINAGSISIVTLLAALLFKDELSYKKAIGVAGVIGGLILMLV